MNVLFACHRLPFPPKRGGKIRPFNIIRHLSEQGHRVTVGSLARSEEELEEGRGLSDYCHKVHVGTIGKVGAVAQMVARLPTLSPSSMGFFYSRDLHRSMREEIASGDFDLVFVHCSSAAQYVRDAQGIASILDFGDMDSQKWLDYSGFKPFPLSLGYRLEGVKLMREEKRLARRFDVSTCTTRAEFETLNEMRAARSTDWFPNGVDAEFFSPDGNDYDSQAICFIGRMDYYPNQQGMLRFCSDVLPLIREKRPDATLTIVGASPSQEIKNLGSIPGVTVTGTVDDVRPYVRRSALSVAPLDIARGTQNKILESMAMGVPVVASDIAARGIDARPGEDFLSADGHRSFADQVLTVLESAEERARLSAAGRERVLSHHSWPASLRRLDGIIESALAARR